MAERYKAYLLEDARTCYRFLQAGFGVIVLTFLTGVAAILVPAVLPVYEVLVMPTLFVGLGLLLYGVGTHLHVMHLNVLEMREGGGRG